MRRLPPELALDSNLLLLLTIGSFEPQAINSFKRISSFSKDDLKLLQDTVSGRRLLVTPHVLTEVSNLANGLPELLRQGFHRYLAVAVPTFTERYTESRNLCLSRVFQLFGMTDAALWSMAMGALVITEDGRLMDYLRRHGGSVMSLSELRELR